MNQTHETKGVVGTSKKSGKTTLRSRRAWVSQAGRETIDGKEYVTTYKYTSANNVKEIVYPNSKGLITYDYNKLNQLQSVSQFADDWKTIPTSLTRNFLYDPAGNLVQMRYNNGVVTTITPNQMSRPGNIAFKVPQSGTLVNALQLNYLYDANGNITNRDNNSYIYDEVDRLKNATVEGKVMKDIWRGKI